MNRIRKLRLEQGMKQEDLAKLLNTKRQSVSRYEKEERGLDVATIHRLCNLFGVTSDYLLNRSDVAAPEISNEEWAVLKAWRKADGRARQMVQLALEPWSAKKEDPADV